MEINLKLVKMEVEVWPIISRLSYVYIQHKIKLSLANGSFDKVYMIQKKVIGSKNACYIVSKRYSMIQVKFWRGIEFVR